MAQTRLHFIAPREEAERLFARLDAEFELEAYPIAIVESDPEDNLFEVSIYVEDDPDAVAGRLQALATPRYRIDREVLPDLDWVAQSLQGLKPVRSGRFLVHGAHDRYQRRPNDIAIEIEAGQAFGTGHHGTTQGCLELIGDVVRREKPLNGLDLGTGSAVLAIAIARLARIPVLATDIDPVATRVAAENVRLNHVARLIETVTATGFAHRRFEQRGPFDLIVANILARPLMQLAPAMARHLADGGSLILSGILHRQRRSVLAAYANQSFRHVRTRTHDGWVSLHLKR